MVAFRSASRKGAAPLWALPRLVGAVLFSLCALVSVSAEDSASPLGEPWDEPSLPGGFSLRLFPSLELGTHDSQLGLNARIRRLFEPESPSAAPSFDLGAFVSGKAALASLGMEESGGILSYGSDLVLGLGRTERLAPQPWPDFKPRRALSARYEWIAYLDTMSTSQSVGLVEFVYSRGDSSFGLAVENDLFGLRRYPHDEYRTAAVELVYAHGAGPQPFACSVALGLKLWTGSTWGEGSLPCTEAYSMSCNPEAAKYSAGVLYVGFGFDSLRVEVGWDSEAIRDFFQNGVHLLLNEGIVPLVNRADKPYIAVKIHPDGDLY
jgi:hypothetical protein